MKPLIETVTSVLQTNEISYHTNNNGSLINFSIAGTNGNWHVAINMQEQSRKLTISSVCPIHAQDSRKAAICELLNRINDNLFMGKFSMDVEDGQISYQVSMAFPDSYVGDETVNMMIHIDMSTFDRYMPAMVAVLYGYNEPSLAFLETQQVSA